MSNVPNFLAINFGDKKTGSFAVPNNKSWYGRWIDKYLPVMRQENWCFEISRIILEELTSANVLVECEGPKNVKVWAINTDEVTISKNVKQMVCDKCGSKISVSKVNSDIWEDSCCIRPVCQGHYHLQEGEELDYYGKLYSQGDLVRILAKEHTGLLERDEREELERDFKHGDEERKPWDANLLSCTPTLEMGIDIGDLSTVILCSIPPGQAQYTQRAGRGGRKDGNALTIAVANARPHDLYFYADPMEMIAGSVEPPKVFLRASAVLSRQFVAYCMDCWVKSGIGINAIPKNLGSCLVKLEAKPKNFFPFNFLNYVQNNMTKLHRMFIQTFSSNPGHDEGLNTDAIEELRKFAKGDGLTNSPMHMMILEAFEGLKNQKSVLQNSIKELRRMMKELEAKPKDFSYDEKLKDLRSECGALLNVVRSINNKDVFNFLSDEGLLPNYAFPEAGIVLKAVLYRKEENTPSEGKRKYEKMVYEYNRSAASAISEFAPLNSFYVDGRKLSVDQVDLTTAQSAKWRLCPNCSHAELEDSGKNLISCPECGSPGWSDAGQVRAMLKVQMVYSNMNYNKSLIGDESDDRTSTFYCKEMLVDVDEERDIIKAYSMNNDEFPFGYEFVQKATMREINFGEKDIVGDKLTVAGVESVRKGFTICKYCGKIQDGKKPIHTMFCKINKDNSSLQNPYEECLFLYREFQTEAIRLLIPSTTMDSSKVRQESFVAAFMLGMKSYFGNVEHLRACVSEVPVLDADYRKQYLVIYDSVPGGTGYLKQLMNSNDGMIEILERALNVMEGCSCKDDLQKDGCYRCLYAYRQSQHIGDISRATAMSVLKTILSGKENIEEIPRLGNVQINSLFESELERRFIEAISRLGSENRSVEIHKQLVNEKDGYSLQVGECLWEIELQVTLDESEGVVAKSRADFLLRPKRTTGNQKPVVIFTDGFQYHKDKVADDTLKRMSILETGKYRVWTLSWRDVQQIFQLQGEYSTNTLMPEHMPTGAKMYRPTVKAANAEKIKPDKENTFELLMDYLANPNAEDLFSAHATAYGLSLVDMSKMNDKAFYNEWKTTWNNVYTNMDIIDGTDAFGQAIFGIWMPRNNQGNINILAEVSVNNMKNLKLKAPISVLVILNDNKDTRTDKYDADWNGYWHFVNVMQFNEHMKFVCETGLDNAIYTILNSRTNTNSELISELDMNSEWSTCMDEFIDDIAKTCAREMMNKNIPIPTVIGFELEDEATGAGIAEAEMAWEELKIVWLLPEQEGFVEIFKSKGWKVITSNNDVDSKIFGGGVYE